MAGVITASEPSWIVPFTGLSPRCFGKLVTAVRRETADEPQRGRPWSLSLEVRILLVTAYWRTNLTLRQLAPLFGVSKSAADRIIDHPGPKLALRPRKRFGKDAVLIVDGTLVPTRDRSIAEQSKNYRYSTAHQVVADADSRLVVVVGRPLPGNRDLIHSKITYGTAFSLGSPHPPPGFWPCNALCEPTSSRTSGCRQVWCAACGYAAEGKCGRNWLTATGGRCQISSTGQPLSGRGCLTEFPGRTAVQAFGSSLGQGRRSR
ncbi:hypothetical protein GCM10022206_93700 [Streptomyces chiangmaiensis]